MKKQYLKCLMSSAYNLSICTTRHYVIILMDKSIDILDPFPYKVPSVTSPINHRTWTATLRD